MVSNSTNTPKSMEEVWRDITIHHSFKGFLPPPTLHQPATTLSLNCHAGERMVAADHPSEDGGGGGGGDDRRRKRMIKNRESASRSRARKQAYTNELELEVANLLKENEKLKRQYEELRVTLEAHASSSTKKTLQRTSTAPL